MQNSQSLSSINELLSRITDKDATAAVELREIARALHFNGPLLKSTSPVVLADGFAELLSTESESTTKA